MKMFVFSVICLQPNTALDENVEKIYPGNHLRISPTVWFVADSGVTTQDVCAKLDVKSGGLSGIIVLKVETFNGFAPRNIWEWLQVKVSAV